MPIRARKASLISLARFGDVYKRQVHHSALFHFGDAGGNTDHHTGLENPGGGHFADEFPQHPLSGVEI